jgi:hypothetical protein
MNSLTDDEPLCISTAFEDGAEWNVRRRSVTYRANSGGLNLAAAEAAMLREAARQGLNLDQLLRTAGRHFPAPGIVPARSPTAADLNSLVTDELRAAD